MKYRKTPNLSDIDKQFAQGDRSLFRPIKPILTPSDQSSILALLSAVRTQHTKYVYLEIGSYKGGSLQPALKDPRCTHIYSIDKRVLIEPDERGETNYYITNSTHMMINALIKHYGTLIPKITTIESDTKDINPKSITHKPDIFFIDAEHTNTAVIQNFTFCLKHRKSNSIFVFHDAHMIFEGIYTCTQLLVKQKIPYISYMLPSSLCIIQPMQSPIHSHPQVQAQIAKSFEAYTFGMKQMDVYRQAYKYYFKNPIISFVLRAIGKLSACQSKI